MSERHYCKYCNAWMQGDKNSIRHHEQGGKHKGMVEAALKQKRKEKVDASRAERELQQQLREVEAAANARFAKDLAGHGMPPPPPPPRRSTNQSQTSRNNQPSKWSESNARPIARDDEEELLAPPKEDDKGIYAVRGTVYLEGKRHEAQLVTGSACQLWVEELDEWLDALVETAFVREVPNTDLVFRRFSIVYMPTDSSTPVTETNVLSDRLRIKLPDGVTIEDAHRMVDKYTRGEAATVEEAYVPVDETTGMGEWSTVEVHQIDESEEAVAQRQAEAEAEEARRMEEVKQREAIEDFSAQGDDALGAFNPWGGSYKGIELDHDSLSSRKAREEEINIQVDGEVSFKKRKVNETANEKTKKKQRRVRSEDD